MSLPKIDLHDGKHKMIVAEEGERVLTPEQNAEYERTHPGARQKPMQANVYDAGGNLGSVGGGYAPDQALVAAKSEGTTAGAVQPGMVRSDSPLAEKGFQSNQGTVAGQGDVGGKHVPIRGMTSTHTSNDDPLLDVSHPQGRLGWAYDCGGTVYDEGGKVQTPLGARIADRANELYTQAKTGDQGSMNGPGSRERTRETNAVLNTVYPRNESSPESPYTPAAVDKVNPAAKTHPEEKRIDPRELQNMSKPLGSVPVYDDGGTVPTDDDRLKEAAQRQAEDEVMNNVPLRGHEQNARDAGQDAKLRRYPQPQSGIARVSDDTDNPSSGDASKTDQLTGANMSTKNAPLTPPTMNEQNAEPSMEQPMMSEASAKTPLGPKVAAPQGTGMRQFPGTPGEEGRPGALQVAPEGEDTKHPAEVPAPDDAMATVQQDKLAAMKKGTAGLTDLGTALIHEKALMPKYTGKGADEVPQGEPIVPEDKKAFPALQHKELQNQLKDYDRRIQAAMNQGTPEGDREAESLQLAKSHLEKVNPYGSDANHPGFLGKLGHVAARVGEGALDAYAGPTATATLIPGSPEGRKVREADLRAQRGESSKEELEAAQAKFAGGKTPQEQDMRALVGQINPDTLENGPKYDPNHPQGRNYTTPEAYETSTTPGKGEASSYARDRVKTGDAENFAEGIEQFHQMQAGNKPRSAKQEEIDNYIKSIGGDPHDATQRNNATFALDRLHTEAKAEAALPIQERRAKFQEGLDIEKQQLAASQNKALEYGKASKDWEMKSAIIRADDKKATDAAMKALDASAEGDSFAAAIVPVMTLLGATRAEQVKRVNKQEMERFMPGAIGLQNWAVAHVDAFVDGNIPPEYRKDVKAFVQGLDTASQRDYDDKLTAINHVFGEVSEVPVPKKGGGVEPKAKPAKPVTAPEAIPAGVPKTATHVYRDKQNNVVGYADGGAYHAIKK
jgi:hypothetical protein